MNKQNQYKKGEMSNITIIAIFTVLMIFILIGLGFSVYRYVELKSNYNRELSARVGSEVAKAVEQEQAKFVDQEKSPYNQFVGPEDLGRVSFKYPKNWSVYIQQDATGKSYIAYFNPKKIRPILKDSRYAIRIYIEEKQYEDVLSSYDKLIKKGEVESDVIEIDGNNATLFKGKFSKVITGAAVVFKIRDKTATIRTDASVFYDDFSDLVKTVSYNI